MLFLKPSQKFLLGLDGRVWRMVKECKPSIKIKMRNFQRASPLKVTLKHLAAVPLQSLLLLLVDRLHWTHFRIPQTFHPSSVKLQESCSLESPQSS